MLPIKKIYVDTKFKTKDSISSSNFKIELPDTLFLPENTVFFIDDVAIPHCWYSIEENFNDKLYMYASGTYTRNGVNQTAYQIITLSPGNYTAAELATEIQAKLNEVYRHESNPGIQPAFTIAYNHKRNTIEFGFNMVGEVYKVLTDRDIETLDDGYWNGVSYSTFDSQNCNEILQNTEGYSPEYTQSLVYISGYISLQTVRNLYLSSPNMGNFNTIGPRGEASIIKKIPVSSNFNFMIFDNVVQGNDYLDCSRQTLRTIEFHLKNSSGKYINLHGNHWSFSIVFDKMDTTS